MLNGVIVFNKPADFTSHDVIAKLRGILKTRKIGHAGTLDPMAEGVLVILVGMATKASDYLLAGDKTYLAGFRLGLVSDTQDIWGRTEATGANIPTAEEITKAVMSFEGGYDQLPPMYSAIQKDGVRLYDLARKGIEVERERRFVRLEGIKPVSVEGDRGLFEVRCSKGTYIRALCHDIGEKLGCGAVMDSLVRLRSGSFTLDEAVDFDTVERLRDEGRIEEALIPMERVFAHLPSLVLTGEGLKRGLNGAYISPEMISEGTMPEEDGVLCALYAEDGGLALLAKTGRLTVGGGRVLFYEKTFYQGDRP